MRQGTAKWKWNEVITISLLTEATVVRAHVPAGNEVTMRFSEVTKRLNDKTYVNIPRRTDGRHCRDRFRLFLEKWVTVEAAAAVTAREGEYCGDYERIFADIYEKVDSRKEEVADVMK